ncbi:MAG: hypothetical protein KDB79_05815 [Acidobacteria bacterium]|nr:hypothetical protein [Acidobacteriota bacterium]
MMIIDQTMQRGYIFIVLDWYRREARTETDEKEFFTKLGRARKNGRAQYLRVQARINRNEEEELLKTTASLPNKILQEYPENRHERSPVLNSLGRIYEIRGDLSKALEYFRKSLEFENEFGSVITTTYLDFSQVAVRDGRTEFYGEIEQLLTEEINSETLKFPISNYII